MFLCDEVGPIVRIPIQVLEGRLICHLAFKYYSIILNHPKLCGSNICIYLSISITYAQLLGNPIKGMVGKKDSLFASEQNMSHLNIFGKSA